MSGVVIVMELMLAGLLALLAIRVLSLSGGGLAMVTGSQVDSAISPGLLARTPASSAGNTGALKGRSELVSRLHILFSLQERDTREQGLDLKGAPQEVRQYAIAWFYGAACALADPWQRHTEELMDTLASLMARKLDMTEMAALQAIMTLTSCSTRLACFRIGLDGAESWLDRRFVPRPHSLYTAITSHALI